MDLNSLFAQLQKESDKGEQTKTAQVALDKEAQLHKLAEDLRVAGAAFGEAAADALEARLSKMAAGMGVPAAGRGAAVPDGPVMAAAKRIGLLHGETHMPGDDTSLRAEEVGALHGNPGIVNPARNVPKAGV